MSTMRVDPLQDMMQSVCRDYTPTRLRVLLLANCFCALLFGAISAHTIGQHEHALQAVGQDAAPSVIASYKIKTAVEAMDTDLVNELLYLSDSRQESRYAHDYELWQATVCKEIVNAAKNITYGAAEEEPIQGLQLAFSQYLIQGQTARDCHQYAGEIDSLSAYQKALKTLQNSLIPNVDKLNDANSQILEKIFSQEESESALSGGLVLVIGICLISILVVTQIYLYRRFRRRFNLPLLFATVCTMLFVQILYPALQTNNLHLKIAKDDSYNSMVALLTIRASAFRANAAESRWLLDKQNSASHQCVFAEEMAAIAHFDPGVNFSEILNQVEKQLSNHGGVNAAGLSGLISTELKNIRFAGEGDAVLEMLQAFNQYQTIDRQMRRLENSGDHTSALEVGLGYQPEASKFSFTKFDDALMRALRINSEHFDGALKSARDDLSGLRFLTIGLTVLVIFSSYRGLKIRMTEYME